jgi:arsenate reductase-like glutaredoxin family protein
MNIDVFSSKTCIHCTRVKEWFEKNQISYSEKDILNDSEALVEFQELQGRATPFIVFKKDSGEIIETVLGFNEVKIKKILDLD